MNDDERSRASKTPAAHSHSHIVEHFSRKTWRTLVADYFLLSLGDTGAVDGHAILWDSRNIGVQQDVATYVTCAGKIRTDTVEPSQHQEDLF